MEVIYHRKNKPVYPEGTYIIHDHFCLFPVITKSTIFWLTTIKYKKVYRHDTLTGKNYWKKIGISYYDKKTKCEVEIEL